MTYPVPPLRLLSTMILAFLAHSLVAQPDSITLNDIIQRHWEFRLQESPLFATSVGVHAYDDQLPDASPAAIQRRTAYQRELLQQLTRLDRASLSEDALINYEYLRFILEDDTAQAASRAYLVPIDAEGGFHTGLMMGLQRMRLLTTKDYEQYLVRLEAIGTYTDQHIALMRLGLTQGIVSPRLVARNAHATIGPYITATAEDHLLYEPFTAFPARVAPAERSRLQQAAQQVIQSVVVPAMQRLQAFMTDTYIPQAPEAIGVSARPGGKEFYAQRVRYFTTLPLTPDEVYARGQQEVARIQTAMQAIVDSLDFDGSFADFLAFLRTDEQFYADSPEALLREASFLAKSIDGKLPDLFNRLPRLPYGVEPVPAAIAPTYTSGRYVSGSADNHRAGTYWVNTYQLENRPLYALPALTLHEAVPGHHLQISLAQEMEGVPAFRQHAYLSAYGEGWGLYSESLGEEMNIYTDLYQQFGRLTYEMWRACRLVVDVGIHAKGWTREQAVAYMADRTALSKHEVNTEIDRYIGWPGQAVSYKIGELKIKELRQRAEKALGEAFDIRAFHDVVLENGAVPLFVLEQQIEQYIEANHQQSANSAKE